jgi:hypothetical protein
VGTLGFFTILITYRSDLLEKLNNEDGIFLQKLHSILKISMTECSLSQTVNPDSSLVALNRAYIIWQPIRAFNDDALV